MTWMYHQQWKKWQNEWRKWSEPVRKMMDMEWQKLSNGISKGDMRTYPPGRAKSKILELVNYFNKNFSLNLPFYFFLSFQVKIWTKFLELRLFFSCLLQSKCGQNCRYETPCFIAPFCRSTSTLPTQFLPISPFLTLLAELDVPDSQKWLEWRKHKTWPLEMVTRIDGCWK